MGPDPHDSHDIVYFKRHHDDDSTESVPGRDALNSWPPKVRATVRAVLVAVAEAPPYRYTGGGYWEAMHGDMTGIFEVRVDGPERHHYRLFCVIDARSNESTRPYLAIIGGLDKAFRTELTTVDYEYIRKMRDEYFLRDPRSLAD